MAAKKHPKPTGEKPKKVPRPNARRNKSRVQDRSTAGRKDRRDQQRAQRKLAALQAGATVVAPPDAERVPQAHGGALLRGGVKGNRGGFIAAMRRRARKRLLIALNKGGGLDFLEDVIAGTHAIPVLKDGQPVLDGEGKPMVVFDAEFRKKAIDTALKFGLGEISQHAIVNENDEQVETGVVELPMLSPAPVPPAESTIAAEAARATVRKAALDAAQALIQAAK